MDIKEIFEKFAADFEKTLQDDNWDRLEKYFAESATYINIGFNQSKQIGREAILEFLKEDISSSDRRFDTRTHIALTSPVVNGNRLSREWRCTYTLSGVRDLVVEGEARYLFEGHLIKEVEQELTPESMHTLAQWMRDNGDMLNI